MLLRPYPSRHTEARKTCAVRTIWNGRERQRSEEGHNHRSSTRLPQAGVCPPPRVADANLFMVGESQPATPTCMKSLILLLVFCPLGHLLAQRLAPAPTVDRARTTPYAVVERGAHHRVLQRTRTVPLGNGRSRQVTQSYTELASGMHFFEDGVWKESQEVIELVRDGAVARHGQLVVSWAPNLNTRGAIAMLTPDGKRLTGHVLGLAYTDAATGRSVLIGQVKDSVGELVAPNRILYRDACASLRCDIRYTYTRQGLEQDVILREAPAVCPQDYDMNPVTTRLEVWTEWVEAPEPGRSARVLGQAGETSVPLVDEHLDFGAMQIGTGSAFLEGEEPADPMADSMPVMKNWVRVEGRTFLIEAVEYLKAAERLREAGLQAAVIRDGTRPAAQPSRLFPTGPLQARSSTPPQRIKASPATGERLLASAAAKPGFVLDYATVIPMTNMLFRADTTYLVTNIVTLAGTTVFEGGSVIKYTPAGSSRLILTGPIECRTTNWNPVVFTARDDHTVGEVITTNSAPTNYSGYVALYIDNGPSSVSLHDMRFRWLTYSVVGYQGVNLEVRNMQFVHSRFPMRPWANTRFAARNVLLRACDYAFGGTATNSIEHGTLHNVTNLAYSSTSTIALTNTILAGVVTNLYWVGANVLVTNGTAPIFQTVQAGTCYLATNSPYRDCGTTNIDPSLLADLALLTTYPPTFLPSNTVITSNTRLDPVVPRDTSLPDLGYHYSPMDYLTWSLGVSNTSTLTLGAGVVVAGCAETAIWVKDGSTLVAEGTPLHRVRILRHTAVQELAWDGRAAAWYPTIHSYHLSNAAPSVRLRFADLNAMSGETYHCYAYPDWDFATLSLQDCRVQGASFVMESPATMTCSLTNNLLHRVQFHAYWDMTLWAFHNLFWECSGALLPDSSANHVLRDNVFVTRGLDNWEVENSHNAYIGVTNVYERLQPTNANDVVLSSFAFTNGPLGAFYQVTTTLVNAGSRLASAASLYHHTTQTNQTKEASSQVDIGLHYVALDANGQPVDTDGDGLPDWLEDRNGDGVFGSGDLSDWEEYNSENGITSAQTGLQVFTPLK